MFTADAVYWGTDTPDVPSPLMRWDRATGAISTVLSNLNGPFYNSVAWNGVYLQFSTVERTSDGYIGDNYIHVLSSLDARSWSLTRTPFVRTAGATDQNAGMWHFTTPDAQGRFWGSFFNLDGTQFKTANILFQIDPNAAYNGARASFAATPGSGSAATFDGTTSTSPAGGLTWTWQYGDGTTGSGSTSTHSYATPGTYVVRLQVKDARGDANETTRSVTVGGVTAAAPSASTSAATNVSSSAATLNGSVNPNGSATTVTFQYGTSTAYGATTAGQSAGSGTAAAAVATAVSGLAPATTYHFRVVATSAGGVTYGADVSFTTSATAPVAPSATTNPASGVSSSGATANGTVNPNGLATTVSFEFGATTAYGTQTAAQALGSGTSPSAVQAALTGLAPGTTYHYRVVATSAAGTTFGLDATFTTSAPAVAPVVTVKAPVKFPGGKAQFNGTINPGGDATTYYFRYGLTTAYGSQTTTATLAAGTTAAAVNAVSGKLTSGATYHLQLVATNGAGTAVSADVTFTAP
jgi:hypothetical protein